MESDTSISLERVRERERERNCSKITRNRYEGTKEFSNNETIRGFFPGQREKGGQSRKYLMS